MIQRQTIDASVLPDHAFGSRSIMWWWTMTIIAIEATVFALAIGSYFYLQENEEAWPPPDTALPGLLWPTVNVFILLVSLWPNEMTKRAAEDMDLRRTRKWIVIAVMFSVAFVAVRGLEFTRLNVSWDSNAEIEIGKLVRSRAQRPEVKAYGERMVADHTAINRRLAAIAAKHRIVLPTSLGEHQHSYDRVVDLRWNRFDEEFLQVMAEDHDMAAELFRLERRAAPIRS